ncbi:MAG: NusG domain II-containing protein [Clostridia bacterium]|nr:NusG domain II-containing protein [Clostridia bacterium]
MKKDWILIGGIVLLSLLLWGLLHGCSTTGETVQVTLDGAVFGTYSLNEPQTVFLPHHTLKIENQQVSVIKSDCVGQDCVRALPISKGNQLILCLPYRLSVQVLSKSDSTDTVTY